MEAFGCARLQQSNSDVNGFPFSKGKEGLRRTGCDKVLPASCRKIKLNNNAICGPEGGCYDILHKALD